jgi:hypothetical protein
MATWSNFLDRVDFDGRRYATLVKSPRLQKRFLPASVTNSEAAFAGVTSPATTPSSDSIASAREGLCDEYDGNLATSLELFRDFKRHQAASGHDAAFALSSYEDRFELNERGLARLEELSRDSRARDVYLTCQCGMGQRCHREILMLVARARFGARIDKVYHAYPRALERLVSPAKARRGAH